MKTYTCPMHPEVIQDSPGKCPKCGMDLVEKSEPSQTSKSIWHNYKPLIIVVGLISLVSLTISFRDYGLGNFDFKNLISYFMTGFFLVFAGFKLIDIKGFAQGYSTYDLLAKRWFQYGYIYPFIELFFGLSMILNFAPTFILLAEFIVMTFSGIGVAIKIARKEKFQCSCLGTFLKVPLTKITLLEDFGMAFLAFLMLLLRG